MKKKSYSERTDIEKIDSNWKKALGLLDRREFSGAIIRAATAAEIAANFVIREELQNKRKIEKHFVDALLKWANGIEGKFNRIILPLFKENSAQYNHFKKIKVKVENINEERNSIVHRGQFKNKKTARVLIKMSETIIEELVTQYYEDFRLDNAE